MRLVQCQIWAPSPNHRIPYSSPSTQRARPPSIWLAMPATRNTKMSSTTLRPWFGKLSYPIPFSTPSSFFRGFQQYTTYDLLAAYGITPSNETTYPLAKIQDTLHAQTGAVPYLGCNKNGTSLSEVWYFGHVFGTVSFFWHATAYLSSDSFRRNNLVTSSHSTRLSSRTACPMFITTRGAHTANAKFVWDRLSLAK